MSLTEYEKKVIEVYELKNKVQDRDAAITGYRQYNQEAHRLLKEVLKLSHLDSGIRKKIVAMTGEE